MDPASMFAAAAVGASVVKGVGEFAGSQYDSEQSKLRSKAGKAQADQVDAAYRFDLRRQISNIRAIRASANVGAGSPTEAAIIAQERMVGEENRRRKVESIKLQSLQDKADSQFYKRAGYLGLVGNTLKSASMFQQSS